MRNVFFNSSIGLKCFIHCMFLYLLFYFFLPLLGEDNISVDATRTNYSPKLPLLVGKGHLSVML